MYANISRWLHRKRKIVNMLRFPYKLSKKSICRLHFCYTVAISFLSCHEQLLKIKTSDKKKYFIDSLPSFSIFEVSPNHSGAIFSQATRCMVHEVKKNRYEEISFKMFDRCPSWEFSLWVQYTLRIIMLGLLQLKKYGLEW